MFIPRTADIRAEFTRLLAEEKFTSINREASMTGLMGSTTIEIMGRSFIADEEAIFGEVNWDWVKREEAWYRSMSLNVNVIPGWAPLVWKAVADKDGFINSNYGYLMFSAANGSQYENVLAELRRNPASRRATAIYTRPTMWSEYNANGMSDFICTNAVGYLIRNGAIHAHVQMRSNDTVFGYKNDRAWQRHILEQLATDLSVEVGDIYWTVTSLHIYARHFYLVDHFARTGQLNVSKDRYVELYPGSEFC